jgi:hypothetical protein
VALGVAGLWFLLDDSPEEHGPEKGALSRTVPAASRPPKAAPSRQAPPSAARPEKRPEGVLEVEVFSENKPLPGAQVQVYEREPADLSAFPSRWFGKDAGPTGADGRWVLPVAPGSYYVTARAEGLAPGYSTVVHAPGSAKTHVRLLLSKGEELAGSTLVKGTGEPVSLAEILLTPPALTSGIRDRLDAPEEETLVATSNEAGEFRFSGLSPGRYRIEARAPGYASVVLASAPIPFRGRATLLMLPGGHLDGTVLGADGQPTDGAEVLAMGREQASSALSDSEGHFSLELPPGAYAVSARKGPEAGALETEVKVAVEQHVQGLRLQLGAGAWLSGKVVRGDGSRVLGARVEAWSQRQSAASSQTGTDETGAFSLPALAAGTYVLHVFLPEGPQFSHGPVTLAAGEHVSLTLTSDDAGAVELRPLPVVEGRILQPYGAPVRHVLLDILPLSPSGPRRSYEFEGNRFELPRFPLGPSQLLVNADGLRASLLLDLQPEERKVLEIPVYPGVSLTGRLVDATTRQPLRRLLVNPGPFLGWVTEQDGRFFFRDLPPGELFLHIAHQPPVRVKLAPEQDNDLGDLAVPAP